MSILQGLSPHRERCACWPRCSHTPTPQCAAIWRRWARSCVGEQRAAVRRLAELDALIVKLQRADPLDSEAEYVQLFDRGRGTSLHLFEHVHGDSRDRGPAMIDLAQTYEKAGLLLAPGELPDYLPAVLEFASTQPPREAKAFLSEMAHILERHLRRAPETRERVRQRAGRACWSSPARRRS